ncbi:5313_t:CDS:2, partial [Funneliformis geosporum]
MIIRLHKSNYEASEISSILKIPRITCQKREEQTLMRKTRENRKDSLEEITEYFNKLNLTQISD